MRLSEMEGNQVAQLDLASRVVEEITCQPFDVANAQIGPLAINYFSFVFSIGVLNSKSVQKVFVKIPKEDLRRDSKAILPIGAADRHLAEAEMESLRTLADQWHADDLGVSWVHLRAEIPDYNAIVTDAVDGDEAVMVFRRLDLRRRLGCTKDRDRLRAAMARLGAALGRFHSINSKATVFRVDQAIPKLERYCNEIDASVRNPVLKKVIQTLRKIGRKEIAAVEVLTLKGIDIRNVLMGEQDRLFLLDPGRLKHACREADLARFIMTYRILYWGSKLFLLGLRPDVKAEQAFLEAYYSNAGPSTPQLLSFFLIKEQIKHWHTALDSLRLLPWATPVKRVVAATYVNRYYTNQLTKELERVN